MLNYVVKIVAWEQNFGGDLAQKLWQFGTKMT